ncbi:MAG TPA: MgtC/SapB family protein [Planctomycetota bacterium]|nr:MgtC/SapB family protein [Planctomycetota bacterium]
MNALDFAVPAQEIANHFAIAGDDLIKLLCATVAGALIGGEREYRDRAAGFRTIIFICVGAAFFTIVSHKIAITYDRDPTRIAANVVSGVGFLGAGVILRDGVRVTGLTTAAIVWVSAALGVGFGAGQCGLAAAGTVITLVVLWVFPYLERPIDALRETRTYEVVCRRRPEMFRRLEAVFGECGLRVRNHKEMKRGDQMVGVWEAVGTHAAHDRLMERLFEDEEVLELRM